MKRKLQLIGQDGKEIACLEISKAFSINGGNISMISCEKTKDGSYRLGWSTDIVENFSEVSHINVIREE